MKDFMYTITSLKKNLNNIDFLLQKVFQNVLDYHLVIKHRANAMYN